MGKRGTDRKRRKSAIASRRQSQVVRVSVDRDTKGFMKSIGKRSSRIVIMAAQE
jgi:hypothetical protein